MSCPSRSPDRPLTANQREHLLALRQAGAVDRAHGRPPAALPIRLGANVNVLGALRDKGLANARRVRRGGRDWTEHFLTEAGVRAVDQLLTDKEATA